jgi:hypothetical protein
VNAFLNSLPPEQRSVGIYGNSFSVEYVTGQQYMATLLATYSWISTSWPDSKLDSNWNLWQLDTHFSSNTFNLNLPGRSINIDAGAPGEIRTPDPQIRSLEFNNNTDLLDRGEGPKLCYLCAA